MRALLLCPPDYYGIEYEINPWMSRARGAEAALAQEQWRGLHATLSKLDCKIELVPPQPKLPDMVFTANAGLAVGKQFIPSNFRHKERAGEAPHFFAVTNSAPTLNLIAPSPRCSDVLLSRWNLSIHAFTISTLVFVRCPTARPFGFRLRSTSTDSTPFANTFPS